MKVKETAVKLLSSFSFIVFSAIALGLIFGGYPKYTNEISTVSLIIAMIFSLTAVSFRDIHIKESLRYSFYAILLNYVVLSGIIILLGFLFEDRIRYGFVIMASVPTAVSVIPITRILKGNTEHAFVSISLIYILSLIFTPLLIFIFLGKEVNGSKLIYDILLLIVLPLILSRLIRRLSISNETSRNIANLCFFILIFGIVGKNRFFLFYEFRSLILISLALIVRTFGIGMGVFKFGEMLKIDRDKLIPLSLFSSFKNDGLAILFCISLLPQQISYIATIPCVLAILFEMGWAGYLEVRSRW